MGLQQAVGATLAASATLPASHDATGVGALTATTVGKLNTLPDLDGTYDIATFHNLSTGEEEKFVDVFRAGSGEIMVGLDAEDAGQAILETAKENKTKVMLEVTLKNGTAYWRQAAITSFKPTGISKGGVFMATVGVEFEKTTIKIAA